MVSFIKSAFAVSSVVLVSAHGFLVKPPSLAELQAGGVDPDTFPEISRAVVQSTNQTEQASPRYYLQYYVIQQGYDWYGFDVWSFEEATLEQCAYNAWYHDLNIFTFNAYNRKCYLKFPTEVNGAAMLVTGSDLVGWDLDFPYHFDTVSFHGYPPKTCDYYCTIDGYPDKGFPPCMAYNYEDHSKGCYLKHPYRSADWVYAGAVGYDWADGYKSVGNSKRIEIDESKMNLIRERPKQ